jgi:hypothetical protein
VTRAQQRIEEYETAAAESDMLAQLTADRLKQAVYAHLASHLRDLAQDFLAQDFSGQDFREPAGIGFGGETNSFQVAAFRK